MKQVVNLLRTFGFICTMALLSSCNEKVVEQLNFSGRTQCAQTEVLYTSSKTVLKTNEYLELLLTVNTDDKSTIDFPEWVGIDSFIQVDRTIGKGKAIGATLVQYCCRYTFEPTVPGDYVIAPLLIQTTKGKESFKITTGEIPISVQSLFDKGVTVDILDLEPPVAEYSYQNIAFVVLGTLPFIILIIYLTNRKKVVVFQSPTNQAEQDMLLLKESDPHFAQNIRVICTTYLKAQTQIRFDTSSNDEIIHKLSTLRIFNTELIDVTTNLLGSIDRAKFSNDSVDSAELRKLAQEFFTRSSISFDMSKEFTQGALL